MSFVMEYWDGSGSRVLTAYGWVLAPKDFLMYSRSKARTDPKEAANM